MIVCHIVGDLYRDNTYIYIHCLILLVLRDLSQPDIKDIFRDAHQSMDSGAGNLGLRSLSDRDDNTLSIYIYGF